MKKHFLRFFNNCVSAIFTVVALISLVLVLIFNPTAIFGVIALMIICLLVAYWFGSAEDTIGEKIKPWF
ncbi:MAG: hypothetical protein PHE59_04020 [Patescibacteria group bacterium]|nr:hypothetical protein [Patescibacteria group bacterium]MDD5164690.1 hypothetical protein [Patescibacteria group bacterium]MDD5534988.1 hypothetical protein [Patescibacteria group bacterium]